MASQDRRLQLTEVEQNLRKLLLHVATYIDPKTPCELRYTGGWVRDKLLGVGSHDIDVAINNMTGLQFGLRLKEYLEIPGNSEKYGLNGNSSTTDGASASQKRQSKIVSDLHKIEANPEKSKHLETVTTKIFGLDIDLVNLRKETYAEDSRVPQIDEVGTATPEEDALRRDATINAMFYNLQTEVVEDLTKKGLDDMAQKLIRTPVDPYQTFKDDPLRILRLVRFASRLGYTIVEEAMDAMKDESIKEALRLKISRERVGVELEKMLRGPDPRYAFQLLDNAGLYQTIFTDPTIQLDYTPEVQLWVRSYDLLAGLCNNQYDAVLHDVLLPDADHQYVAWLLSAFLPWCDAPLLNPTKPGGKAVPPVPVLVAREGVKAPTKICDIVAQCGRNAEEIISLKSKFVQRMKSTQAVPEGEEDPCGRDTLGMAIRKWGSTWRSQAIYAVMYEATRSTREQKDLLQQWVDFVNHLRSLDLLTAYEFKPIVDGKALAKALSTPPGPWMKSALDVIMAYQLRNPSTATAEGAISALRNKQGELPALLVRHFLQLTIRPLFAKTQTQHNVTSQGRRVMEGGLDIPRRGQDVNEDDSKDKPWKSIKEVHALELLKWVLSSLDAVLTERNWPLLLPPILTLLDDTEIKYKVMGCEFLSTLLRATPSSLLARTGLGELFHQAIEPSLSYLPTLTPEQESIALLNAAYPAMLVLGNVRFNPSENERLSDQYVAYLTSILHNHLLPSISHVEAYPQLTATLLTHTRALLDTLGTDTISQLKHLLPLLTSLMTTPFISAEPIVILEATKTLQVIIACAWPRMWFWHGEVLKGLCGAWRAVDEERERWTRVSEGKDKGHGREMVAMLEDVRGELVTAREMLFAACESTKDEAEKAGQVLDIESVETRLVDAEPRLEGLFVGRKQD